MLDCLLLQTCSNLFTWGTLPLPLPLDTWDTPSGPVKLVHLRTQTELFELVHLRTPSHPYHMDTPPQDVQTCSLEDPPPPPIDKWAIGLPLKGLLVSVSFIKGKCKQKFGSPVIYTNSIMGKQSSFGR